MKKDRLITLAIHTYPKALILKGVLESQGIAVVIQNVNLLKPVISPGVRGHHKPGWQCPHCR